MFPGMFKLNPKYIILFKDERYETDKLKPLVADTWYVHIFERSSCNLRFVHPYEWISAVAPHSKKMKQQLQPLALKAKQSADVSIRQAFENSKKFSRDNKTTTAINNVKEYASLDDQHFCVVN